MSFEKLYKELNLEQKKAVDLIEGPVMVIAGPGTGKTKILTLRIANILKKTQIEPENILALTFTDSGAFSIRSKLISIIGNAGYLTNISTFHGFCNNVIKNYPESFPKIVGSENISEIKQIKIIKSSIEETNLELLKPHGDAFLYLKSVISAIDKLKREGLSYEDFTKIIKKEKEEFNNNPDLYNEKGKYKGVMKEKFRKIEKRIKKNEELSLIYKKYQEKIGQLKLYDYNDMITETLRALSKDKELLLSLQEQYQYILVDEHQDTNNAQNKILELLLSFHKNPNIFIVGDQKQAIYRFQGASALNFNYFKKIYPEINIIKLKNNYRSTKNILDVAENIIPSNIKPNIKYKGKKVEICSFLNPNSENYFVIKNIEEKIKKKTNPSEIAIIYRDNKDILPITCLLDKKNIPFFIDSQEKMTEEKDLKKIIIIIELINDFGNEEALIRAMHIDFLKIDPLDIFNIVENSRIKKMPVYHLIKSEELNSIKLYSKKNILCFLDKISYFAICSKNENFIVFLEKIINDFKIIPYLLKKQNAIYKIEKLKSFFEEAKKYEKEGLKEFIEYLKLAEKYNLSSKKSSKNYNLNKIRLLTAHKAKGLEFDYVYIIKALFSHWGNRKRPNLLPLSPAIFSLSGEKVEEEDENEEEKKLFYVALTRAKKEVFISYSKVNEEGKEQIFSKFIKDIKDDLIVKTEEKKEGEIIFNPPLSFKKNFKNKDMIKNIFIAKGLSVTGLNNYIQCPLKYFYTNLIKIPRTSQKEQIYGTAVHETLKDFFNSLNKKSINKNFLLKRFYYYLNNGFFNEMDLARFKKRGEKSLEGYYNFYKKKWIVKTLTEFKIKGIVFSPEIHLNGKIDKIEFLNNKEINVVDYKTGKTKSRNQIEGKTKDSDGNIKRQLVFYNILLNRYKEGKYKMISGEIDFVEPNEKNIYKKEKFEITEEEIKKTEELIKKTSKEILSLSFLKKGCGKKDCPFCELKEIGQII